MEQILPEHPARSRFGVMATEYGVDVDRVYIRVHESLNSYPKPSPKGEDAIRLEVDEHSGLDAS